MRIKCLRNIGIQTVREFSEKGLTLDQLEEGKVYDVDEKVGEGLLARGLGETTTEAVTKDKPRAAADQPADSKTTELSRPAAGTGHEGTGDTDPKQIEPGRQPGNSMTGTGDVKTEVKKK